VVQVLQQKEAKTNRVAKGRAFESEVAEWLEKELRHEVVLKNEWVECAKNLKPFECDIHTRTSIRYWDKVQKLGLVAMLVGAISLISGVVNDPFYVGACLGSLLGGGGAIVIASKRKKQRNYHVWVECKNLSGKVNRDHVRKLHDTVWMLKDYRDAKWKPDFAYIFSASDFEPDALSLANTYGIDCYRKSPKGFERVN
jgi:hypothetical protein